MRLVVNLSNVVIGGGIQVSLSFLEELKVISGHEYYVFVSSQIAEQLNFQSFDNKFTFYKIDTSPARLRTRNRVVNKLSSLESEIGADVVFTVFGPSYWKPKAFHVMGIADGWCYNPESVSWSRLPFKSKIRTWMLVKYKKYFFVRDANVLIAETESVKGKVIRYIAKGKVNVRVVSNTCSSIFSIKDKKIYDMPNTIPVEAFKLVSVSAYYPNKNLEIIRDVIPILYSRGLFFHFVLTIAHNDFDDHFKGCEDHVTNLGPVTVDDCPSIYGQCDALFLPTLLESFTVSYLEAMITKRPILTSDLDFARDICGDAACYFQPLNADDVADKIEKVITEPDFRYKLIQLGEEKFMSYPSAQDRARSYIDICDKERA